MAKPTDSDHVLDDADARFSLLEIDGVNGEPAKLGKPDKVNPTAERLAGNLAGVLGAIDRDAASRKAKDPALATIGKKIATAANTASQKAKVVKPEVSDTIRDLATKEVEIAKNFGIAIKDVDDGTFFTAGTTLWGIGDESLEKYAQQYAALPTIEACVATHNATIAAELRQDITLPVNKLGVDGKGLLRERGNQADNGTFLTELAFVHIKNRWGKNGELMEDEMERRVAAGEPLPSHAWNLNAWLPAVSPAKTALIRRRFHRTRPEVYAVFSGSKKGYAKFDGNEVLALVAESFGDLKCELKYDADSTRMKVRAIAQAPIDIPAFNGVGRVHRIGFDLKTTDNGGSIHVSPFLIRVRCKNASLVHHGAADTKGRFRHVGDHLKLKEAIAGVLLEARESIDEMRALWTRAAGEYYLDPESGEQLSVREAIARLVAHEHLPVGGLPPGEAVEMYLRAWQAEDSPSSAMGILMAVQRAAHEGSWRTKWAEDEIEGAASALLYNNVLDLRWLDAGEDAEA